MINPWAPDETASAYNGPFSHKAETHSFTVGVYHGLRYFSPSLRKIRKWNDDVAAEPHYFAGGYAVGVFVKMYVVLKVVRELRRLTSPAPRR